MTAEKFLITWIKSEILTPRKIVFKPSNYYLNMYRQYEKCKVKKQKIRNKKEKGRKNNVQN